MAIELSQFHEGENKRSDRTRRNASSKSDRITDHIRHQYELYDQQREIEQCKGKSPMTPAMESKYTRDKKREWNNNEEEAKKVIIRQRDGKTSLQSEIRLGYDREKYRLRGGTEQHARNFENSLSEDDKRQFNDYMSYLENLVDTMPIGSSRVMPPRVREEEIARYPRGIELFNQYLEQMHRSADDGASSSGSHRQAE